MRLRVDTRLPHDLTVVSDEDPPEIQRNRAVYRITEVISETPWSALYRAKKVFHNFDFKDRRLVEVDQDECLDVFVKTLRYPVLDQRAYVTARRDLAWFEAKKVMGCRKTNLIPEPLGFLEVRNDEDVFSFPRLGQIANKEPVLICEAIHGESLARWRQRQRPELIQILRVLGELLELMGTFHEEKMLINHVGPAGFWIDSADRVHFMGTESVVDRTKAAATRLLFPPQRYSRGFAAPELSDPALPPSAESDLYGWAAIAYFLITGESPAALAAAQQQPWARFDSPQRNQLLDGLQSLSSSQVGDVQKWFGVQGSRFPARWPDAFVDGLLVCLDPDPAVRPPEVKALQSWWMKAPPARVPTAVAVQRENGHMDLRFSTDGLPHVLTYMVRRKRGSAPRTASDGIEVWKGPLATRIEDAPPQSPPAKQGAGKGPAKKRAADDEWHYSVFSQDFTDSELSSSAACPVLMLDGRKPGFARAFAEQIAAAPNVGENTRTAPLAEFELIAALDSLPALCSELFDSTEATVRSWGVQLLDQRLLHFPEDRVCFDALLQHGLSDPVYQLRRDSAAVLVKHAFSRNVEFVVAVLAPALGGVNLDDRIRAVRGMTEIGLSKGLIDQAIRTFELDRLVQCGVCQGQFRAGDIDEHLIQTHGFVPLDGDVLPLGEALKRLWAGVFQRFDPQAFRHLARELSHRHGEKAVEALKGSFRQRFLQAQEDPAQQRTRSQLAEYLAHLVRCLVADPLGEELCCHLLVDENPALNQLGRQFFARRAAQELSGDDVTVAKFRQWIEFLVPQDQAPERIQISEVLVALGANATVAQTIRKELELSRITLCPECGESLPMRGLGRHRRTRHQIFEFENQRFTLAGLVGELSNRLISHDANLFTATTLVELHEEQFAEEALKQLCETLYKQIQLLNEPETRPRILVSAASSLAPVNAAYRLCHQLLKSVFPEMIEFGLLLFGHLAKCPDLELARRAASLVGNSEVSSASRGQATAALVRWAAHWPDMCRKALLVYANGISSDPLERSDALQALQERTGESEFIQEVSREQTENQRIRCPKCEQILTGREMRQHALTEHQRIFDGRALRRPWSVAVETLETYANHPDAALLNRGEKLAQVEYPQDGLVRFVREALKRGIDPGNYRQTLVDAEPTNSASICPGCFELVPRPLAGASSVECHSENELKSEFVSIKRQVDSWIWISSEIQGTVTPWTGFQPGWSLTKIGLSCVALALTWIPAAGLLLLFGSIHAGVMAVAQGTFLLGTIAATLSALFYRPRDAHVLDTAWAFIVPHLLASEIRDESRTFIAGLSSVSVGRGNRRLRQSALRSLFEYFDRLADRSVVSEACLGALARLQLHDTLDRKASGNEILNLVTPLLRGALSGERPLSILNLATTDGNYFGLLPAEIVEAIRWRILQIAHALEWSFPDVFVAATHCKTLRTIICPSIGSIRDRLADAWALLDLKSPQLPKECQNVPELIDQGRLDLLEKEADLLCQSNDGKISVCSRGVIIEGTCYPMMPSISVNALTKFVHTGWTYQRKDGGPDLRYKNNPPTGYQKHMGYEFRLNGKSHKWWTDPTAYANQMRAFSALLFQEIRMRTEDLERQSATYHVEQLFRPRPATCLNCGQRLIHVESRFAVPAET